jgi:hypothetical protein
MFEVVINVCSDKNFFVDGEVLESMSFSISFFSATRIDSLIYTNEDGQYKKLDGNVQDFNHK